MALGSCNRTHYWEDAISMCVPCFSFCEQQQPVFQACEEFCKEFLASTVSPASDEALNLLHILWLLVLMFGLFLVGFVCYRRRRVKRRQCHQGTRREQIPEPGQEEMQLMAESGSDSSSVDVVYDNTFPSTLNLSLVGPGETSHDEFESCERSLLVGPGETSCNEFEFCERCLLVGPGETSHDKFESCERSLLVGGGVGSGGLGQRSSPPDVTLSLHSNPALDKRTGEEGTPEHLHNNDVTCVSQSATNHPLTSDTSHTLPLDTSGSSLLNAVARWPPIADEVYDYLDREQWVKLVVSSGGLLEMYVAMDMSLGDAKNRILDNNKSYLASRQLKVYNLVGSPVVRKLHGDGSIVAGQQTHFEALKSTISYFLYCKKLRRLLMVTTAHKSSVGTRYYADANRHEYIGTCIAAFDNLDCDVAFIEVERDSQFYKNTCNFLPSGRRHQMCVPSFSRRSMRALAEAATPITRHGREPIAYGQFSMIRERRQNNPAIIDVLYVLKPDGDAADFSQLGDSGSPITSRAADNGDTQLGVKLYGHLLGDYNYRGIDGQEVGQTVGLISSLPAGIMYLNQSEGQNNEYTLEVPDCKFHKITVTSKPTARDTGYHSVNSPTDLLVPTGSTFF